MSDYNELSSDENDCDSGSEYSNAGQENSCEDISSEISLKYIKEIYDILEQKSQKNYKNALEINMQMQRRLFMLQAQIELLLNEVKSRYAQCNQRLMQNMKRKSIAGAYGNCGRILKGTTFYIRGNTFFKDENGRSCPNNDDYMQRSRKGEMFPMDLELVSRHIWSLSDKIAIVNGIKEQATDQLKRTSTALTIPKKLVALLQEVGPGFQIDWDQVSAHNLRYRHSPTSCAAIWNVYLQPALNHDNFSKAENERLLAATREYDYQNWSAIAEEVGQRSDYQCFIQYYTSVQFRKCWSRWDKKDDKLLLEAIDASKCNGVINWCQVSFHFPHKSKAALQQRYAYAINPSINHAPFSGEEDLMLLAAVQEYGMNFAKFPRSLFPDRSIPQLRARYTNTLQHRHKSSSWTLEDDRLLLDFVKNHGESSWKLCSEHFDNRHTRTSCRQRYTVIMKYFKKDSNLTLEQLPRRAYRMIHSNVTPTNWEQKVEDLSTNPYVSLKAEKKPRKRYSTKGKNKRKEAKHDCKNTENKSLENEVFKASAAIKKESSLDLSPALLATKQATKQTARKRPRKPKNPTAATAIRISAKKPKLEPTLEANLAEFNEDLNGTVACNSRPPKNSAPKRRKQPKLNPIYIKRLRANDLQLHNFFKYAYNFQFGKPPMRSGLSITEAIDAETVKSALGFVLPSQINPSTAIKSYETINGRFTSAQERQRWHNLLRLNESAEPSGVKLQPNYSTLAALRAVCVLAVDHAPTTTTAENTNETICKSEDQLAQHTTPQLAASGSLPPPAPTPAQSLQHTAVLQRFRQRFRALFYQTALLSRLTPSKIPNLVLPPPKPDTAVPVTAEELTQIMAAETTAPKHDKRPIVKCEASGETYELISVIKCEVESPI